RPRRRQCRLCAGHGFRRPRGAGALQVAPGASAVHQGLHAAGADAEAAAAIRPGRRHRARGRLGMTGEAPFAAAGTWLESNTPAIAALSDRIWDLAEPGLCETRSAAALCELLERHGFTIETGVAGLPTAFVAEWGEGRPRIA